MTEVINNVGKEIDEGNGADLKEVISRSVDQALSETCDFSGENWTPGEHEMEHNDRYMMTEVMNDARNGLSDRNELNQVISRTVDHVLNENCDLRGGSSASKKGRNQNENQVKRPMNAFMVYAQVARKKVAHKYPNLSYRKLSKTLGELWRMLDDEERKPFVEEADRLRRQHKREHPTYKFQPQRRRKKGNKSAEAKQHFDSGATFVNKNLLGNPSMEGKFFEKVSRQAEEQSAADLLQAPYLKTDGPKVSTTWPFATTSSESYMDKDANIMPVNSTTMGMISRSQQSQPTNHSHRPFPEDPNITRNLELLDRRLPMNSSPNTPHCYQNAQVINSLATAPEQATHFRSAKFSNPANSGSSSFFHTYPASTMQNFSYPQGEQFDFHSRNMTFPSTRSMTHNMSTAGVVTSINELYNPYKQNVFTDLPTRPQQTRNDTLLSFMENI